MVGGAGNDIFNTAASSSAFGNDTIDGGTGSDTLSYTSSSINAATVNLATHSATNAQGNTTLISIETVLGTAGADSFTGGDAEHATDSIGNRTGERFRGNAGNDTITGATGADFSTTADYANNSNAQAVSANLFTGTATDGLGGIDTLVNVDGLRGGSGNDLLVGGSLSRAQSGTFFEQYRGNAGDDTLNGGNANSGGKDSSNDRADYANNTSTQAINVNLGTGIALDGLGGTDTLIGIEQVDGGAGNDTLTGGSGDDAFDGGAGNDTLNGGAGAEDGARYSQSTAGVIVNLSAGSITVNAITVAAGKANDGMGGTDSLLNIENARGSDFDDYIRGSDAAGTTQSFSGDSGDDTIDGGAGIDFSNYSIVAIALGGLNASIASGSGTVNDRMGGTDTLINVEGLGVTHSHQWRSGQRLGVIQQ